MARIRWSMMDPPASLQVDFGTVFKLTLSQTVPRQQQWYPQLAQRLRQARPLRPALAMESAPHLLFKRA
jgi:hypothetical protein